ncbi:TetR/AcrR family transcriptional regulator [Streptacidiphilus sp. P02-A3a]|uniref:TetR/AcrR family transcriptional regulator n=1 Tax=Streptacidiphilus sp. P02-A3a TaxID=2704468 RepID=UPI0015FE701C|nr:helix-turn-helix domain-containing protein [Streptacidiphilus sp. P02-A3a]QMU69524.1 helix-turn-helix transcriptional regulator [Streptacidiphilus sp. P02-A3a]
MATDRDAVLHTAVGVLSRQPTAAMDEIARAAGISRATLHRMFPGRDALVREVGAHALRRMAAALDAADLDRGDPVDAVRRLAEAVIPEASLAAFLTGESRLFDDDSINAEWDAVDARVAALFLRGQKSGAFRIELPAAWLSEAFFDLLAGVGWAVQDGRLAPRDSNHALTELFLGGALRRDPR